MVLGGTGVNAVNVGIGTTTPATRFHLAANSGATIPMIVQNTMAAGNSGIHFRNDLNVATGQFGSGNASSANYANRVFAGSITAIPFVFTTADVERMRIDATGNVGIGTNAPTTDLEVNGFTKLGSNAPGVKMIKLTGTTSTFQGGAVSIPHGLNITKILSVSVLVEKTATNLIPPGNTTIAGDEYHYQVTTSQISVTLKSANSGNLLSKPVRVLITYEE